MDLYCRVEAERLGYLRNEQNKLRVGDYDCYQRMLQRQSGGNPSTYGRRIVLPSTFIGSPRHMCQLFQVRWAENELVLILRC